MTGRQRPRAGVRWCSWRPSGPGLQASPLPGMSGIEVGVGIGVVGGGPLPSQGTQPPAARLATATRGAWQTPSTSTAWPPPPPTAPTPPWFHPRLEPRQPHPPSRPQVKPIPARPSHRLPPASRLLVSHYGTHFPRLPQLQGSQTGSESSGTEAGTSPVDHPGPFRDRRVVSAPCSCVPAGTGGRLDDIVSLRRAALINEQRDRRCRGAVAGSGGTGSGGCDVVRDRNRDRSRDRDPQ